MGSILSKLFFDFYIFFIFTRPLSSEAMVVLRRFPLSQLPPIPLLIKVQRGTLSVDTQ